MYNRPIKLTEMLMDFQYQYIVYTLKIQKNLIIFLPKQCACAFSQLKIEVIDVELIISEYISICSCSLSGFQ